MGRCFGLLVIFIFSRLAWPAGESAQTFTVNGTLYSTDDFSQPLSDSSAKLNIKILDPSKTCVLYEEEQTVNTSNSEGRFTLQVGSNTGSGKRTGDDPNHRMIDIWQNVAAIAATNTGCVGGQYVPVAGDARYVRITLTPSSTNVPATLTPDMYMGSVPNALVCESVQGLDRSKIAEFGTHLNGNMTAVNLLKLFNNGDAAGLHHHDGRYAQLNNSQSISLAAQQTLGLGRFTSVDEAALSLNSTTDVGKMWMNSDTGKIMYWDGMSAVEIGGGAGGNVSTVFGRSGNVTAQSGDYNAAQITNSPAGGISSTTVQTAVNELDSEKVTKAGDAMTGALSLGNNRITDIANPSAAQDAATKSYVDAENLKLITKNLPPVPAAAQNGQSLKYDDATGAWVYYTPVSAGADNLGDHVATQNIELGPNFLSGDGDNEGLSVDASGYVGIGTSTPAEALEVVGSVQSNYMVAKGVQWPGFIAETNSATNGDTYMELIGGAGGNDAAIGFMRVYNKASGSNVDIGGIEFRRESANDDAYLQFKTRSSGGTSTERMRITSSGNVGVGTASPNASALMDLSSTTRGFLLPRMTTAQRDAIAAPVGLQIYNTTSNRLQYFNGSAWFDVGTGVGVGTVFGRTGAVTAQNGDYSASQITNVAAGNISAVGVQAAINELDAEKLALAGGTMSGAIAMSTNKITGLGDPTAVQDAVTKNYADSRLLGVTLAAPTGTESGKSIRWNVGGTAWEYYTPAMINDSRFPSSTCASGNKMRWDGSVWQCEADATGSDNLGNHTATVALQMAGNTIYGSSGSGGDLNLDSTSNATKGNIVLQPSGGNVGIGITNPAYKLTVTTNSAVKGSNPRFILEESDPNTSLRIMDLFGTGANARLRFFKEAKGTDTTMEYMTITSQGRVGIGTASPRATLDVSGTIVSGPAFSNGTSTIDFSTGNLQYTASNCGAFVFHNLKDGGSYMFAVQGTAVATCSFTAYSDTGTTALTVHMPPDHGATTTGKHTIYNMAVLGTHVYIAWTPGY